MSKANVDQSKCLGCGGCIGACPLSAISIDASGKAVVDQTKCVGCGACAGTCPQQAIELKD